MQNDVFGPEPAYPVESVRNALLLLTLFRDREAVGVSEAARVLGVARSTAHRLLSMLAHLGFVERHAQTRAYRVGPTLLGLASATTLQLDIRSAARPALESLVAGVNETAHLCVLRGTDVAFVDCVESTRPLRATSRTGQTMPAYATAAGKALLAARSDDGVTALFPRERLRAVTGRTLVTRTALLAELRQIRRRGYATNTGESEHDLSAVARAVAGQSGVVRAAVTVAGPSTRFDRVRTTQILASLEACTLAITEALA